MTRESGQATIEMIYAFPLLMSLIALFIWAGGGGWAVFWMDYQLQDAVLCLNDSSVLRCETKFIPKMKKGSAFVHFQNLILKKGNSELYGQINFSFPFSGKKYFSIQKTIPLPLIKSFRPDVGDI